MILYHYVLSPLIDYGFMRRALTACAALSIGGAPLGVFLVLRRMTLIGDAISHAILPGVSIAFLCFGLSVTAMTIGGLIAGIVIAVIAGSLTRFTQLKEDASFTSTYLLSLTAGVLIISLKGSTLDLMHVLFGNVLAIDNTSLLLVSGIISVSTFVLALLYRNLIVECFDPDFLRSQNANGNLTHMLFLVLVVLNLVAAFQALGTLMSLGIMVLPAIASRFWTNDIDRTILFAVVSSFSASFIGLLLSYHYSLPSGPAIALTAGMLYIISVIFGRYGSLILHFFPQHHFTR